MNPQRLINKFTRRIFLAYSDLYGFLAQKLFNVHHLYPSKITFKITNICNVDCHFCYNVGKNTQAERKSEIDLESWKKLVSNSPFYTAISFTGGEAFLYPHLFDLLKFIGQKKRKASIVSNGTTLNEEQLNKLIDSKLHYLMFSLHGMERTHNRILGGHINYFEKTTETIKKLEELKKKRGSNYPIVGIKVVITNENYQDIPELMDYSEKELKASHLYFNLLSNEPFELFENVNDAFKAQAPIHMYEKIKIPKIHALIDHIFDYKKTSRMNIGFTNVFKNKQKLKDYVENPGQFDVTACNKPFHELYIQPNGDVIFCLKYKVTNIKDINYDIRNIFALPRYRELLEAFQEKGKKVDYCHTCLEATFEDKRAEA
ncbi:MoaA/NifB/PqqE/SkfB family radical SAM enzyme [Bacteriovorax stolpii]|nr:radical SAM protein [Bacteriovorax stolpii]TDP54180.1 MoaA/NifB/PqqE/SkfB family radical SAM enzyme [Bacteriovorax stolpii]